MEVEPMGQKKGYTQSPEHIRKRTEKFKGIDFEQKFGKEKAQQVKANISKGRKGKLQGKDNPMFGEKGWNWKGDKAGYAAIHIWVRKNKPMPNCCEDCKKETNLELANISGEYRRDIEDYKYLCPKCHFEFDFRWRFLKQYSDRGNAYIMKYVDALKKCRTDEEIGAICDRVYSDGFTDGSNEATDPDQVIDSMAGNVEFIRDSRD